MCIKVETIATLQFDSLKGPHVPCNAYNNMVTVMGIASIYPIVTKYSPENFGKTHIQYSDT